jgi:transposase, IS5 family
MRKRFDVQYELGATPIDKVQIPTKSRDEMPAVLRALQHIYSTPELNEKVFAILERKITKGINTRTGRPGAMLWEIFVFGVVRQAREMDFDHLHHVVNYDGLVRKILGISDFGDNLKTYSLQTIKDNVALLDEETLDEINTVIVKSGHQLKKNEQLNVKIDSFVVETNVHFPTDLNLLWDAGRKCLDLIRDICEDTSIDMGWRKHRAWRKQLKSAYHKAGKRTHGNGCKTVAGKKAALAYLQVAEKLSGKIKTSKDRLKSWSKDDEQKTAKYYKLHLFEHYLDTHIRLVRQRIILDRTIPHKDKMFSLFEPHTRWIKKGKAGDKVELGLPVAIATDQYSFILAHHVMEQEQDVDIAVPLVERLTSRYRVDSASFDKGFWSPTNQEKLKELVNNLVLPKKGKRTKQETEREHSEVFRKLRRHHAAIESNINCLEHHALNRCPDKGPDRFKMYCALGIVTYNLHKVGNILLEQEREISKNKKYKKAA